MEAAQPPWSTTIRQALAATERADEFRLVYRGTPLRCAPTDQALYERPWDLDFDYLQCSQLRPGDPVRVLGKGKSFWFVWSPYVEGWLHPTYLSQPITRHRGRRLSRPIAPTRLFARPDTDLVCGRWRSDDRQRSRGAFPLPLICLRGTTREPNDRYKVAFAGFEGIRSGYVDPGPGVRQGYQPLTRRNFFATLFGLINAPYGWGGTANRRDCSRLLMDVFSTCGLFLPRNSAIQAAAAPIKVSVGDMNAQEKIAALTHAAKQGIVLLKMPGHIMVYLGQDNGEPFAFHLFYAYITPCPNGGESKNVVNRATVSPLRLGRDGSRKSYLERITTLAIIG